MITLNAANGTEKTILNKFSYNGTFMGESFLSATIASDKPINFELGDYAVFRNERYGLNYTPAKSKKAKAGSYGEAFVYENIKLNSLSEELTRCDFLDYVLNDNLIHFSASPNVRFYAIGVKDLADRIQANLNRIYTDGEKWLIQIKDEAIAEGKEITLDGGSCWDALALVNSVFGLNFIIKGRCIVIGTAGIAVGKVFGYGKGKGLYDIQQVTNENAKIITRLRVYGSRRNMPNKYYNKLKKTDGTGYISELYYAPELRLPDFPAISQDPYLDSDNIAIYGIREGSIYFDGNNDTKEIFPSLEGMTKDQLQSAGISVSLQQSDNGNIDEILRADNPNDNGEIPEDPNKIPKQFTVYLKDLGFDLAEKDKTGKYKYATTETMQIALNTGMCSGRKFDIVENGIKKINEYGVIKYKVECNRFTDTSTSMAYPNFDWQIQPEDKFVILGIEMPEVYIKAASQKLLEYGTEYLANHDKSQYTYLPKIDEIFMARNPELGESIKEGDILNFDDTDLNIDASVIIQTLKINYGENPVPTYEVTLSDKKITSTVEKMQNSIDSLMTNRTGVTLEQVRSLIESVGSRNFLSKMQDDTAEGNITFMQNVLTLGGVHSKNNISTDSQILSDTIANNSYTAGQLGSGFKIWKSPLNGQSYAEFDNLLVRRNMDVSKLTINEIKSVGGQILVSMGHMVCIKVEDDKRGYICYFDTDNGKIKNLFAANDQVICQRFDSQRIVYYWRRVMELGTDYIVLSQTDADGNGIPAAGDEMIQFGNRTQSERQSAILISAYGANAPSITQYAGVDNYNLTGKEVMRISPNGNKFSGTFEITTGGSKVRVPADRGRWESSVSYGYYDRVSHKGALWLCIIQEGQNTIKEPNDNSTHWLKQVSQGQKGDNGNDGKDGRDGVTGTNGFDGSSSYFHVRYSANANGNPLVSSPQKYIGTVVTQSAIAPTEYAKYTWYEWKGVQGTNGITGKDGENGKTSYLHIKYSNDGGKSFTANSGEDTGKWIGQYVDFTEADSNDLKKYTWSKIKGESADTIYIKGTNWSKDTSPRVEVRGQTVSTPTSRGLTLTVLRRSDLNLIFKQSYDVYGTDEAVINNLSEKIQSFDSNYFIILNSKDAIKSNTSLSNALISVGGTGLMFNGRTSFAFIGYKGLMKGTALEMYVDGTNEPYFAEISTNVINGCFVGTGTNYKAVQTVVDASFQVLDNAIRSKVNQSDFNSLQGRVSTTESKVIQNANSITTTVEKVEKKNTVYKSYTNVATDRPSVPYAKNDIWITYDGIIKQSNATRISGAFVDVDWAITTKYTDDTEAKKAQDIAFKKIRYIRDWLNGSNANTGNHWVQIQAFDIAGTNIALNKNVSGASTDKRATNGNTATNVYTGAGEGLKYLTVDLGAVYSIEKVKIWHYYADKRIYKATKTEVSVDNINWFSIFDSAIESTYKETEEGRTYLVNGSDTGRNRTFYSDVKPTVPTTGFREGDLWYKIKTIDGCYETYRWDGTDWVQINVSVSKAKQSITDTSITNLVNKTGINSLGSGQTLYSQIQQTAEKITLEVGKIEVGGTNLVRENIYTESVAGYSKTKGRVLLANNINRISLTESPIKTAGDFAVSFWYKVENYTTPFTLNPNVNDKTIGTKAISGNIGWTFYSGTTHVASLINTHGFIDIEGIPTNTKVTISDLVVIRGNKAAQTWMPAPEDMASKEEIKSSLTLTDNKISLLSKTIELNGTTIAKAIEAENLKVGNRTGLSALEVLKNGTFYAKGSSGTNSSLVIDSQNQSIEITSPVTASGQGGNISNKSTISVSSQKGGVEVRNSNGVSMISANGLFANSAGQNAYPLSTGVRAMGAVVGLGFGNMAKDYSNSNFLAGVIGQASNSNSNPVPAYGGYFDILKANGIVLSTNIIEGNTKTTYLTNTTSLVVSISSNQQIVYLPNNAYKGTVIWLKQWFRGYMRVYPRSPNKLYDDSSENSYLDIGEGWTGMLVYVDDVTINNVRGGFWLLSKFRF